MAEETQKKPTITAKELEELKRKASEFDKISKKPEKEETEAEFEIDAPSGEEDGDDEEEKFYCDACGEEIEQNQETCKNCGVELDW